jgi:four helix bundle protein
MQIGSMRMDHERLDVYQLAREFRREAVELLRGVPRGHGETVDQLYRSSLAIKLNIAEGTGEFALKEKARFYRLARREAAESAALLDDLEDLGLSTGQELAAARRLSVRIVSALIRLIQALDAKSPAPTPTPAPAPKPAPAPTRQRKRTPETRP